MALDDDRAADLYEMTQQMTHAAGLPAYEFPITQRPVRNVGII
jgi:hypothetical protein